jgi:hypothetical protein
MVPLLPQEGLLGITAAQGLCGSISRVGRDQFHMTDNPSVTNGPLAEAVDFEDQ